MYYTCFISMCPNNSKRTPNKTFIRVPTDETRRKEWFKVARVSYNPSKHSKRYVCDDHFDLEHDLANYDTWILRGGPKILRPTAIPHKFNGLPNRNKLYCIGPPPVESNEITSLINKRATLFEQSANLHSPSQEENLREEDTLTAQPLTTRNTGTFSTTITINTQQAEEMHSEISIKKEFSSDAEEEETFHNNLYMEIDDVNPIKFEVEEHPLEEKVLLSKEDAKSCSDQNTFNYIKEEEDECYNESIHNKEYVTDATEKKYNPCIQVVKEEYQSSNGEMYGREINDGLHSELIIKEELSSNYRTNNEEREAINDDANKTETKNPLIVSSTVSDTNDSKETDYNLNQLSFIHTGASWFKKEEDECYNTSIHNKEYLTDASENKDEPCILVVKEEYQSDKEEEMYGSERNEKVIKYEINESLHSELIIKEELNNDETISTEDENKNMSVCFSLEDGEKIEEDGETTDNDEETTDDDGESIDDDREIIDDEGDLFANKPETEKLIATSNESDTNVSTIIHTKEKHYKCDTCDKKFTQIHNLNRHTLIHAGKRPFKCDICDKTFIRGRHLKRHALIHTGEKPFKCDKCEKSFRRIDYLKAHILNHIEEKPFKCDNCEKSFNRKDHLNIHALIHTGEKRFKCDNCEKSFAHKHQLKNHALVHTGEKPFKCDKCIKSFTRRDILNEHVKIHATDTLFKCDKCEKTFHQKKYLTKHNKRHILKTIPAQEVTIVQPVAELLVLQSPQEIIFEPLHFQY